MNAKVSYPASFQLVAAMNPCRCGYLGYYPDKECRNARRCGQEYSKTLSGLILDRIDLFVNISRIESRQILDSLPEESSGQIRQSVISDRAKQLERYQGMHFNLNCHIDAAAIAEYISLDRETTEFLTHVVEQNYLSLRGYDRILKVARTIADLENSDEVNKSHVTEVLYYKLSV
ncbi:magnesium chelatase subunit ChlI family protein [Neorickettsia helminthoeca]|uniref:magnesium chelatase subunit ChlI family protein n=1 Tax=Neorickettsia helminthoeca TaxID=33994 RepID=UPI000A76B90A|nr:ATP-binding protein [Neorickettsia helminthoeca]